MKHDFQLIRISKKFYKANDTNIHEDVKPLGYLSIASWKGKSFNRSGKNLFALSDKANNLSYNSATLIDSPDKRRCVHENVCRLFVVTFLCISNWKQSNIYLFKNR